MLSQLQAGIRSVAGHCASFALSVVQFACHRSLKMFLVDYLFNSAAVGDNAVVATSTAVAAVHFAAATDRASITTATDAPNAANGANSTQRRSIRPAEPIRSGAHCSLDDSDIDDWEIMSNKQRERLTRSIVINHGQHADQLLFRLRRGNVLRIVPGASLMGRRVAVYGNLPVNGEWG